MVRRCFTSGNIFRIFGVHIKKLLSLTAEDIRDYCLLKKGVEEGFPFGNETLVFKVGGKLFALMGLDSNPIRINLKCAPAKAIELREAHSYILPGYHMNKAHWNTVVCEPRLKLALLQSLIDHSYELVYDSLSKKTKEEISR